MEDFLHAVVHQPFFFVYVVAVLLFSYAMWSLYGQVAGIAVPLCGFVGVRVGWSLSNYSQVKSES
jgi:hypothetical protein